MDTNTARLLQTYKNAITNQGAQIAALAEQLQQLQSRPTSVQEEIDAMPGRRIESTLSGEVTFGANDEFQRGNPIIITVSQDGPFVMTHYPQCLWRPTAPNNATNFGRWRPVTTFPLPVQTVDTDIIDLMYEIADGGAQRNMQNQPRGPLFSRPDNIVPAPLPTVWSPNSTIVFTPTYLAFTWDGAVPPTAAVLHVDLIGYRIANM